MNEMNSISHEFVCYIPPGDQIARGVVYVSIPFATAVHLCCCRCGGEVVTPLDPNQWQLTFDGKTISLSPSIGNWNFDCKSHYWIRRDKVAWAPAWYENESQQAGYKRSSRSKKLSKSEGPGRTERTGLSPATCGQALRRSLGRWLRRW